MDASGRPFIEAASTVNVSKKGVLVKDVPGQLAIGDIVGLSFGKQKGKFRVMWVGQPDTDEAGHVGLQSLDARAPLWEVNLPDTTIDTYIRPPEHERRRLMRLKCSLSAEVRGTSEAAQVWVSIRDLSRGGCYIGMLVPLPVESKLRVAMWLDRQTKIWADGIVISSHPGSGIGVKFLAMSRPHMNALERFLSAQDSVTGEPARIR